MRVVAVATLSAAERFTTTSWATSQGCILRSLYQLRTASRYRHRAMYVFVGTWMSVSVLFVYLRWHGTAWGIAPYVEATGAYVGTVPSGVMWCKGRCMIAQVYTRDMYIETPVPNPQVPTLWPEAPPRAHRPSPFPPKFIQRSVPISS